DATNTSCCRWWRRGRVTLYECMWNGSQIEIVGSP
ncbi:hypothetical protein TSMEX_008067, partial [Taenia solium]